MSVPLLNILFWDCILVLNNFCDWPTSFWSNLQTTIVFSGISSVHLSKEKNWPTMGQEKQMSLVRQIQGRTRNTVQRFWLRSFVCKIIIMCNYYVKIPAQMIRKSMWFVISFPARENWAAVTKLLTPWCRKTIKLLKKDSAPETGCLYVHCCPSAPLSMEIIFNEFVCNCLGITTGEKASSYQVFFFSLTV